jgi:hypothetical protein
VELQAGKAVAAFDPAFKRGAVEARRKAHQKNRPYSLGKTTLFDFVLKGRGFKPRRTCHKNECWL